MTDSELKNCPVYNIKTDIENVARAIELAINNGKVTGLIENSSITFVLPFSEIAKAALNASTAVNSHQLLIDALDELIHKIKGESVGILKRKLVESSEFKQAAAALKAARGE